LYPILAPRRGHFSSSAMFCFERSAVMVGDNRHNVLQKCIESLDLRI
jgi:hypothetical protein